MFATDPATHEYYERRAREYDSWWKGTGRFADRHRPGWQEEVAALVSLVVGLAPVRTLDVACGTAFLTRHLRGSVVGLDQSPTSVAIAQSRLPTGLALVGDALSLPFADRAFDRVVTAHFYGHLPPGERDSFISESRRVACELIVIDSARSGSVPAEEWQQRVLDDGSVHRVFKRYLTPAVLDAELHGTEVLMAGQWFVAVRARLH